MLFRNSLPPRENFQPSRKPLDKHLPFKLSEMSLEEIREVVRSKWKLLEVSQLLTLNLSKAPKMKKEKVVKVKKEKVAKPPKPGKKLKVEKTFTQQQLDSFLDL